MFSRVVLSRIVALVVALFLTAVATSAVARESRAVHFRSQDYPTVQVPDYMRRLTAAATLIDRIRKVE